MTTRNQLKPTRKPTAKPFNQFNPAKDLSKSGLVDYIAKRQKYYLFSELKSMPKAELLLIVKGLGA